VDERKGEMNPTTRTVLTELRTEFEALYGERLVKLLLFGSQARGDTEDGSDIDVLVVLRGHVYPGVEIDRTVNVTARLSLKADAVISCVFVSVERYSREKSPLLINVRREGVAL
jgi:predicted nucleotidyltransferase